MSRPAAFDLDRSWRRFSALILGVLSASILAVLGIVGGITALKLGALARAEQDRRAGEIARFVARASFLPVSLGDTATLARILDVYAEDRDVVSVSLETPNGKTILRREFQAAERPGLLSFGAKPVLAPQELVHGGASKDPVAVVQVILTGARVRTAIRQSLAWVLLAALLLAGAAVLLDLVLISRMTGRLKDLIDRARRSDELARSNVDLEQFAYVASHDLQEPLRKIVSFSELLRKKYSEKLDASGRQMLELVVDGGQRMRLLIQDLLAYARVQSQARPLEPVAIAGLLNEARESVDESAREARAAITADESLPVVLGDPSQLRQVFQNLLSNAVKFHRQGVAPVVRVSARPEGKYWRLSVSDNGIGIPPEHQSHAFEMMRRLHPRGKYPGTGIGLALCKRIVERHGGRIWLESAVERGTTIHFTVPSLEAGAPQPRG